ncbi:hypothetical protein MTR67_017624, partial [Solanum verrucosum]
GRETSLAMKMWPPFFLSTASTSMAITTARGQDHDHGRRPSASTQSVLSWRKPYSRLFERSRPQEVFFFFFFKSQLFCLPIPNFAFSVHHSSATSKNEMLVSKGLRSPSFLKTGTTIVGLIFKVLTLEFLQRMQFFSIGVIAPGGLWVINYILNFKTQVCEASVGNNNFIQRGAVKLRLPLPRSVDGVTLDPNPDWTFDALLVKLNSIEKKLNASSKFPIPFTKTESRQLSASMNNSRRGFVMQVSDDDVEDMDRDTKLEVGDHLLMGGKRFACDEIYLSDSDQSEEGLNIELQHDLMDKVGLVESALSELAHDHQLTIAEEMRDQLSALEAQLTDESEKLASTLERVERNTEAQREMNRKFDMQYQRKIAEALDDHLTTVQRDHKHRSQIEERRIRDDAAREEAKRKEKVLQEEKARQERIKAETKVQARLEAEKVEKEKATALEAERKAAKEAAAASEKKSSESVTTASSEASKVSRDVTSQPVRPISDGQKHSTDIISLTSVVRRWPFTFGDKARRGEALSPICLEVRRVENGGLMAPFGDLLRQGWRRLFFFKGNTIRVTQNAQKLEEKRLAVYNEIAAQNEALGLGSNKVLETSILHCAPLPTCIHSELIVEKLFLIGSHSSGSVEDLSRD